MAIFRVMLAALLLIVGLGRAAAQPTPLERWGDATGFGVTASAYAFTFQFDARTTTDGAATFATTLFGEGTLAPDASGQPALALTVFGQLDQGGVLTPVNLTLRVADGVLYTAPGAGETRWTGVYLDEVTALAGDLALTRFLSVFDPDVALLAGLSRTPTVAAGVEQVRRSLTRLDIAPFVTVEPAEATTLDGHPVEYWRARVDVRGLFETDEMVEIVRGLIALGEPTSQADWGQLAGFSALLGAALDGTTLTIDGYRGVDDGYLHRLTSQLDLRLDFNRLGGGGEIIGLTSALDLTFSNFNNVAPVTAPDNALVIGGLAASLGIPSAPMPSEAAQAQIDGEPISPDTPTTVELTAGEPTDLIYSGAAGETISVVVRSLEAPGTVDTTVEVLDSAGVRLAFNDDHITPRAELAPFDSVITGLDLPASGDYIIRVDTFTQAAEGRVEVTVESDAPAPPTAPTPIPDTDADADADAEAAAPLDETITGTVPDDSSFLHTFDGVGGQVVTITARATTTELDPRLTLTAPDGSVLAENDDHGTADPDLDTFDARVADVTLPQTGAYTIAIAGFAGTGGPFELTIVSRGGAAADGGATTDDDDDADVAPGEMPPRALDIIDGEIAFAGDRFIVPLEVEAGDVYTLTARATNDSLDTQIYLFDADDGLINDNDDHGTSDRTLAASDARIRNHIFQAAGRYEIEIVGWSDTRGPFELQIEQVATDAPLGTGSYEIVTGEIDQNGQFTQTFDAQAGDFVTLTVRGLANDFDTQVALLGPDGDLLADNDDNGSLTDPYLAFRDARITNYRMPASGSYTVSITGFGSSSGPFALTITTLR